MSTTDRIIQLIVSVFLIVGVYQFYFWSQRNPLTRPRQLRLPVDDWIPYRPRWVWVYSFLYYPVMVTINCSVSSPHHSTYRQRLPHRGRLPILLLVPAQSTDQAAPIAAASG